MIMIDGKEYRNLEEQVQKNKEDIAKHYQAMQLPLNLAGIEVIGSITDPSELDGVVGENFGDAYVQVVGEDTILWIWTRANPNAGEDEAYWLDIPFTTVGEQGAPGPIGPQGPQGTRGSLWFTGKIYPGFNTTYRDGDMYLNSTDGSVYRFKVGTLGHSWEPAGNISGPRGYTGDTGADGPQGPKGERGPEGPQGPVTPGVVINAILNSVDELPRPTELNNLSTAYIVNGDLYIQIGPTPATAIWTNMGSFSGGGTTVFKNGVATVTWDANTKLDKVTTTGGLRAYCVGGNGGQEMIPVKEDVVGKTLVRRTSTGQITAGYPHQDDHAATKAYVDEAIDGFGIYSYTISVKGPAVGGNIRTLARIAFLSPLIPNSQDATASEHIKDVLKDYLAVKGYISSTNVLPCSGAVYDSGDLSVAVGLYYDSYGDYTCLLMRKDEELATGFAFSKYIELSMEMNRLM